MVCMHYIALIKAIIMVAVVSIIENTAPEIVKRKIYGQLKCITSETSCFK